MIFLRCCIEIVFFSLLSSSRELGDEGMKKVILHFMLFLVFLIVWNCQHARVQFPVSQPVVTEPKECKPPVKNKKACEDAKAKQEKELVEKASLPPKEHILQQKFFLFGFYPKKVVVDARLYCPGEIMEIYQYSTFVDLILEQATFGIYMPRTMKITCAP